MPRLTTWLSCYFGETGQQRGISGRVSTHKKLLRRYRMANLLMQLDWFRYSEQSFEFIAIDFGPNWTDKNARLVRQAEFIQQHRDNGGIVYNTFDINNRRQPTDLTLIDAADYNALLKKREEMSNQPRGGNPHDKAIFAEGNVYLTISEASRSLELYRNYVINRVNRGEYAYATEEQVKAILRVSVKHGEKESVVRMLIILKINLQVPLFIEQKEPKLMYEGRRRAPSSCSN
jgi:hypothetical protein